MLAFNPEYTVFFDLDASSLLEMGSIIFSFIGSWEETLLFISGSSGVFEGAFTGLIG
jgi:hypothetical protein